jgi:phosphonate transport system substrate-binding protein
VYDTRPAPGQAATYRLAVHPLHNPTKLFDTYQPLLDYLEQQMPEARFVLVASRDYPSFEQRIRSRDAEFLLPNPWQTLGAMKMGFRVIAMAGDAEDFKGIFIVRRDSAIHRPSDLRHKAVSYPAPTALAACIMPQAWLHSQGIDVNREIENRYVGSQESSIMNVFQGRTAVGATWPPPWRAFQKAHPEQAAELKVLWETPHLINNSLMVRDDVPAPTQAKVRQLLLRLHTHPQGQAILARMETARFHGADNSSYEVVQAYMKRFERQVRLVEWE